MADDRIINIANRVGQIVGDRHIEFHAQDPNGDLYHFHHKKNGKKAVLTKEHLEKLADEDDDPLKKHIIDLFA